MNPLFAALRSRGWSIRPSLAKSSLLPRSVAARYPNLPSQVIRFLSSAQLCLNADKNVWFLTRADFRRKAGAGFRWNEYEHMGLEEADDAGKNVVEFWNGHFPFLLSVESDYDYLAVRLTKKGFGNVVHGSAPEWESPSRVAGSFSAFLKEYLKAACSEKPKYPYSLFL